MFWRRFIEALPNMGFAPCYVVYTWRVMRLSHKRQISRLAHPFKVSCLRADYTLVNFNNESHSHSHTPTHHVNFDGEPYTTSRRKTETNASHITCTFRGHRWQWNEINRRKAPCLLHCQQLNIFSRRAFSLHATEVRQRLVIGVSWTFTLLRSVAFEISNMGRNAFARRNRGVSTYKSGGSLKRFTNNWLFFSGSAMAARVISLNNRSNCSGPCTSLTT